jgi:hypothetical protein
MNAETIETPVWAESFRLLIERAGGELVGVKNGEILFRADADSPVCSLYPFACTEENVRLALKSVAEAKKAAMWELMPQALETTVKPE